MPDEQDVQNERNDRTEGGKDSRRRGTKSKAKRKAIYGKLEKKKRPAWNTVRVREKDLNGRQSYREGRGPTEETQSCRNNREIEREARIKLRGKNRWCGWCGGRREERKRKERRD